jgi:hypothetical protein
MRSPQTIEELRRMSVGEKLRLVLQMIREATPDLLRGTPEQVERRFELLRRQNDERNRCMLEGWARAARHQSEEAESA